MTDQIYLRWGKRAFDLLFASLFLILLSPLLCVISLALLLQSNEPVFFSQLRVGMNGRLFRCWKFRTMREDADDLRSVAENAVNLSIKGILLKPSDDPRVTPVGRVLRKTSLDELPQLFNVLLGDMSLVGPRPLIPFLVEHEPEANRIRSAVKPGITGFWQIYARNECTSVLQMIRYDHEYIRHLSLATDLKVLAKTLPVVLLAKGAR